MVLHSVKWFKVVLVVRWWFVMPGGLLTTECSTTEFRIPSIIANYSYFNRMVDAGASCLDDA